MTIAQKPNKRLIIGVVALGLSLFLPGRWVQLAWRTARLAFTAWALGELRSGSGLFRRGLGLASLLVANKAKSPRATPVPRASSPRAY